MKDGQKLPDGRIYLIESDAGYINLDLAHKGNTNSQIIKEYHQKNLNEEIDTLNLVTVYAVLQKYNIENRNGRVYTKEILERENIRYQEFIKMKTSLGELNHPEQSVIDLGRVSHYISETWWEGRTLMGKVELITSPGYHKSGIISCVGDQAVNLIKNGVTIGVSSRGVGSLKNEGGKNIVQSDFELICWDLVSSPSTPNAWISTSKEVLKPYVESVNKTGDVLTEDVELLNRLNKFLL